MGRAAFAAFAAIWAAACTFEAPPLERLRAAVSLDAGAGGRPDAAWTADSGGTGDALTKDAGPRDADFAPDGPVKDSGLADMGFDTGARDSGFRDAAAPDAALDAGFPDATPVDSGIPPNPCDLRFTTAQQLANVRDLAPQEATDNRSAYLSPDGTTLYTAFLMPSLGSGSGPRFEVWLYRRAGATGPFGAPVRTNLDFMISPVNSTAELDLRYVPALNRFWFTVENLRGVLEIDSAEVRNPSTPQTFWDFSNEVLGFPADERMFNYSGPALSEDGLVLVSARHPGGGGNFDLVEHTRTGATDSWVAGVPLDGANTATANEADAWIDAAGTLLLFASDRSGQADIFCTSRGSRSDRWATPVLIMPGVISHPAHGERAPFLSAQGLIFTRRRSGGGQREELWLASP